MKRLEFSAPVTDPWVPDNGNLVSLNELVKSVLESDADKKFAETAKIVKSAYEFVQSEHPMFQYQIQACAEKQFFLVAVALFDADDPTCKSTSRAMFLMEHFLINDEPRFNRAKSVALQTYLTLFGSLRRYKSSHLPKERVTEELDRHTLTLVTVGKDVE